MRGLGHFYRWTKAGMEEALPLFYEAIKTDPDYSLPYGMAAVSYVFLRSTGWVADFAPLLPKVVDLVAQAPTVGRDDAFTLAAAGFAAANILNDLDTGAELLDRALALNENFSQVWVQSAYVRAWLGESELALAQSERARRLSPVDPQTFTIDGAAALAHFLAGRSEEAL